MKHYFIFFLQPLFFLQLMGIKPVNAQEKIVGQDSLKMCFYEARETLDNMLSGKTKADYEKAIFVTENAYCENKVIDSDFEKAIDYSIIEIQRMASTMKILDTAKPRIKYPTDNLAQKKADHEKLQKNWAIYTYMTDTTFSLYRDTLNWHQPYYYSTTDPFGTKNWANTQVFNLLSTHTGNCYAMACLYKIFSDRLQTGATIATSSGHAFIRQQDDNGITYNVELASHEFPGSGTIETLTYTTNDAIKSGIAMRSLTNRQAIGMCLICLAKGYENKFQPQDDNFILECAELALKYDSLNLNAMLLKAEVLEERVLDKHKQVAQLKDDKTFKEYESLIKHVYMLGYREMPVEMQNILLSRLNQDGYMVVKNLTPQPFTNIKGAHAPYATITDGLFDEEIQDKPIEKYHCTLFDTKTKRIVRFTNADSTYNNYITDPTVLAWNIDPHSAKYPSLSPYSALANNPIIMVDPDGNDNVIYLVVTKSGGKELAEQKIKVADIIKQANENFKNLGLKTTVVAVTVQNFDITKIDKTDAVAVIGGSTKDVISYVSTTLHDKAFANDLTNGFEGGSGNPEDSKMGGNIIGIDGSELNKAGGNFGQGVSAESGTAIAAFVINHGAGHNAGETHSDAILGQYSNNSSVIMFSGNKLASYVTDPNSNYPTFSDVLNNKPFPGSKSTEGRNQDYVNAIMKKFGNNDHKVNYPQPAKK